MSTRFINCEVCQTEGRILTSNGGPDEIDNGPCPACNGECVIEVETEPCDFLTECPSCKQMYENGGQCAAPVMRGAGHARRLSDGRGLLMPHIGVFDFPTYYERGALDDDADYVIYGARLYTRHLPSASYWMVPETYKEAKNNARTLDGSRPLHGRSA